MAAKSGQDTAEPVAPKPHSSGSKAGEPAAEVKWVVAANVVPVAERDNEFFVAKGHLVGLRKDMLVQVVGPPQANGKRKLLGQAKVLRRTLSGPGMPVELSDSALAAKERRFVVVPGGRAASEPVAEAPQPVEPPPPPVAAPEPPAPPAPKPLSIHVRQTGSVDKDYVIENQGTTILSRCRATLNDRMTSNIRSLMLGENRVDGGTFQKKWDAPVTPKNHMLIECAEGRAEVGIFR